MIYVLSDTKVEGAVRLPVIKQRFFTPSIDFSKYDYLIFTSKNGVLGANNIDGAWKKIPALVIGEATAKEVERLGGKVAFIAREFYSHTMAEELKRSFPPQKRYLYLRAKKVLSNMVQSLQEVGFNIEEVVVYETICAPCDEAKRPPKGSVIIFSSPSTVRCFLECYGWDESFKAIAIGKKTAQAFKGPIKIAPKPTLQSAVEFATKERFSI